MTTETPPDVGSVRDQAAYWTVLLHTVENLAPVLPLFYRWLEAAPAHRPEFVRVDAVWRALDDLRDRGLLCDTFSPIPSTQPLMRPPIAPHALLELRRPEARGQTGGRRIMDSWRRTVRVGATLGAIAVFAVGLHRLADEGSLQVRLCDPVPSKEDARHCWMTGFLSFNGETLAQVAQQFNRYNHRKLFPDADITQVPIAGLYPSTDPDGFADALQGMLGIEHTLSRDPKTGEETIHLHRNKPHNPSSNTGDRDPPDTPP
jgi:ferric-dicitrate binding protein FerR (iron transport regulator)